MYSESKTRSGYVWLQLRAGKGSKNGYLARYFRTSGGVAELIRSLPWLTQRNLAAFRQKENGSTKGHVNRVVRLFVEPIAGGCLYPPVNRLRLTPAVRLEVAVGPYAASLHDGPPAAPSVRPSER